MISPRLELFFALAAVLGGGAEVPEAARRWRDQSRRRLDHGFRRRLGARAQVPAFWTRIAAISKLRADLATPDVDGVISAVEALPADCFQPDEQRDSLQSLVVDALRRFDRLAFAAYWRNWREDLVADAAGIEARLAELPVPTSPSAPAVFVPSRFAPPGLSVALADATLFAVDPDRLGLPALAASAPVARAPTARAPGRALSSRAPSGPRDPALVFRALGDATRYSIAGLIARGPMTSADLARRLGISKPTMAHHLRALRSAGLVHEQADGNRIVLTLDRLVLEDLSRAAVAKFFGAAEDAPIRRSRRSR
jgi:DNA-binding transcriptional ArsR family regulator